MYVVALAGTVLIGDGVRRDAIYMEKACCIYACSYHSCLHVRYVCVAATALPYWHLFIENI